jgi:hypothetical protein
VCNSAPCQITPGGETGRDLDTRSPMQDQCRATKCKTMSLRGDWYTVIAQFCGERSANAHWRGSCPLSRVAHHALGKPYVAFLLWYGNCSQSRKRSRRPADELGDSGLAWQRVQEVREEWTAFEGRASRPPVGAHSNIRSGYRLERTGRPCSPPVVRLPKGRRILIGILACRLLPVLPSAAAQTAPPSEPAIQTRAVEPRYAGGAWPRRTQDLLSKG